MSNLNAFFRFYNLFVQIVFKSEPCLRAFFTVFKENSAFRVNSFSGNSFANNFATSFTETDFSLL